MRRKLVHARFGGRSYDIPMSNLDVGSSSDGRQVKRSVAQWLNVPESNCKDLHVGLHADYCEVIWHEQYRVPNEVGGDVFDYPLARNLVLMAVSIASETIVRYVIDGERRSWSATLGDFAVRAMEAPEAGSPSAS